MLRRGNPNQKLDALLHAAKMGRLPYEREAWLNVAFFLGHQYTEWHAPDSQAGYIREIARDAATKDHPRVVINKIMHFVRTAHADALQDEPTGDVLPPTSDYSDLSDARVSKAWIEDQASEEKTDYAARLSRAALWAMLAGTGYLKWCWNPETNQPHIVAPSFFEIYLDPYAKMFKDSRYIIHSQFMDVEQVFEAYGREVQAGQASSADETKTQLLRGMGAAPVLNGVVVNEIWYKPCRRYPKGMYCVWTGSEQLVPADSGLPYPHLIEDKMLPFTQLGVIERPDSPYYLSPVEFLRPPQMELNVYHNQMMLARRRFANFKWLVPNDVEMDTDPDDSPSQILRYSSTSGSEPKILQPGIMPATQDLQVLEEGMMHVVGQREVSNAQVPGRVEAAKAIELLKEADAGALAVLRKTIKSSNNQGWYHLLQEARAFQSAEDMVTTYSREGLPEVRRFKAGEMKPGQRIRTTTTTGLARSRANKQELLVRLWEQKVITDPETMAELLEMPLPNTMQHRADDVVLARNENLTLAEGKAIVPNSWDEHDLHLREHNAFRKTSEFLAASADVKQKFEMHCQTHEKLLIDMLIKRAKHQMILQGGQPSPDTPTGDPNQPQETT